MNRLQNKVAIVTGSTSGIGVGIARLFAKEGANVIVCGRRKEKGEAVVAEIREESGNAMFHYLDLTAPESITALISDVAEVYGKIDVLVNNAANVALKDGKVEELTTDMFNAIVQSDLTGTFAMIKEVIPHLRSNNGGSIINISSMAALGGDLGSTAYACAKAGVDILTQYTALQYGKENIRCNGIRPGLIVTPENDARVPQALKDIFVSNILGNRYGCPEDIGHLCVYLASDESEYVSGQVWNVDGGMNSHVPTVAQFRSMGSRTW